MFPNDCWPSPVSWAIRPNDMAVLSMVASVVAANMATFSENEAIFAPAISNCPPMVAMLESSVNATGISVDKSTSCWRSLSSAFSGRSTVRSTPVNADSKAIPVPTTAAVAKPDAIATVFQVFATSYSAYLVAAMLRGSCSP